MRGEGGYVADGAFDGDKTVMVMVGGSVMTGRVVDGDDNATWRKIGVDRRCGYPFSYFLCSF